MSKKNIKDILHETGLILQSANEKDIFQRPYDGLFSVTEAKTKFLKDGSIIKTWSKNKPLNKFDIYNHNIYDYHTKEIIEVGKQFEFNTSFLLKISKIYILDVEPFLTHHYQQTSSKKNFINYLKFAAVPYIKSEPVNLAIADWLKEVNLNDIKDVQTSIETEKLNPTREYLDQFTNHIHSNEILNLSNRKSTNGGTNKFHYSKYAQGIEAAELKELEDVKFIDTESFARVKEYIKELSFIRRDLFRFFIKVTELDRDFNTFENNRLGSILTGRQIKEYEILDTIKSIEYLSFFVNSLIAKGNMADAVLIKRITIDRLKRLFKFFMDNFEIDLKASPFGIRIAKLIDELNHLISSTDELKYLEKNTVKIVEQELTQPQIAIIHAYKNEPISRDNGADVAKTYGFTAKTSGEKLYHLFNKYYSSNNRKGDEGTKRKNVEKIKLIESIIEFLPEELKGRACDEMKTLQIINNTEYY